MDKFIDYKKLSANAEKYGLFFEKLVEDNEKFNLTGITDEKEVAYKHFIDSVMGCGIFKENSSVVEIGSGAGFPSVPVAIERKDLKLTLIEANNKKCNFLREVNEMLRLDNVTVICDRAEVAAKKQDMREKFDYAIARAVAPVRTLLEYCMPLVKVGGACVFWKGDNYAEEIKAAENALKVLGADRKYSVFDYDLGEYGKRTIVIINKTSVTPAKYPRGLGKERKCPL